MSDTVTMGDFLVRLNEDGSLTVNVLPTNKVLLVRPESSNKVTITASKERR